MVRNIAKIATTKNITLIAYSQLDNDKSYIFVAGHSFPDEITINILVLDRNAYVLLGTTNQIDHNPQMYFAWLNGLIYVNKLIQLAEKMYKKLSGMTGTVKTEEEFRNIYNMYVICIPTNKEVITQDLGDLIYPSMKGKLVVPMVSHNIFGTIDVLVKVEKPIDFTDKSKKKALIELRDVL